MAASISSLHTPSSPSSLHSLDHLHTYVDSYLEPNKYVHAQDEQKLNDVAYKKVFIAENMSSTIIEAKYAVRGAIVKRAKALKEALLKKDHKYPFNQIIFCNIGNPQAFCPPPITFHRKVLSCVMYPPLMDNIFKSESDVVKRAKRLLSGTKNSSIGAYTDSRGMKAIRDSVAEFIFKRDGFKSNPDQIMLTDGASAGIKKILKCLVCNKNEGILVPIPQYPLYSATITLLNGSVIPYYLDEENDWSANLKSIEDAVLSSQQKGIKIKGIVVINPGNPTGQCISKTCINSIISSAYKYNFAILADEVYQENIYYKDKYPFVSFKKCLMEFDDKIKTNVELFSFHSVSKGIFGECGLRGGYMEIVNIDESGMNMLVKLASISLCPNTVGQCMVDLMVNPPQKGDESFNLFDIEYKKQYNSLQERAKILSTELNNIKGISCNTVYGAMYAFPKFELDVHIIKNVRKTYEKNVNYSNQSIDFIYCSELLENKGICVVPGSGFGQKENTFHFRTTLLPPKDQIQKVVKSIAEFHAMFTKKYS